MALPFDPGLGPLYALIWVLPFLGLWLSLGAVALAAPRRWWSAAGGLAAFWAMVFVICDAVKLGAETMLGQLLEILLRQYLPLILLLVGLFLIGRGIRLRGMPGGRCASNTVLLALGTMLASILGTIGATMVMLPPLIALNRDRRESRHIFVFFIFLVGNIGGVLTPLGSAPLFLGYLKGIAFFWPVAHLILPTVVLSLGLLASFYALDRLLQMQRDGEPSAMEGLKLEGGVFIALLVLVIAAVLLRSWWTPISGLVIFGVGWNLAEIVVDLVLAAAIVVALFAQRDRPRIDDETRRALCVLVLVLAAVLITLIPITAVMAERAAGPAAPLIGFLSANGAADNWHFYVLTGFCAALFNMVPAYLALSSLAAREASVLMGPLAQTLAAVFTGAVYFGGMTYFGNAANLLVKASVERAGIRMPGFFGYIAWSSLCLLPWLFLTGAIFFR